MTANLQSANSDEGKPHWIPILANPTSGPTRRGEILVEAIDRLKSYGLDPQSFTDRDAFCAAIEQRGQSAVRCVVAAGGDGTVQWVLNRQVDRPTAILPLGSENLLARLWNIPTEPEAWSAMVLAARTKRLDLAEIDGHRFSLMASAGFDADIVHRVHRKRQGHVSRLDYLYAIFRSLRKFGFPPFEVTIDGKSAGAAFQAFVFNQPAYAMKLPVCEQALPDDGLLDIVLFPEMGRIHLARYSLSLFLGWKGISPTTTLHRGKEIRLTSKSKIPVQADGDPMGFLPINIRILPGKLDLIVP